MENNFSMGLKEKYFKDTINGKKSIEFRLNDKKRQQVNVGDYITFYNQENKTELFRVKIRELIYARTFKELLKKIENMDLIYSKEVKTKLLNDLETLYSLEDVNRYGTVGIKFE